MSDLRDPAARDAAFAERIDTLNVALRRLDALDDALDRLNELLHESAACYDATGRVFLGVAGVVYDPKLGLITLAGADPIRHAGLDAKLLVAEHAGSLLDVLRAHLAAQDARLTKALHHIHVVLVAEGGMPP